MPGYGDERIEAIRKQAEDVLAKLNLNAAEEAFAREHAKVVFDGITEAYLAKGNEFFDGTRALSAAAAVAYALILVNDWASKTDTEFPPKSA